VDDYELVATSMANALQPLQEFISQASDIGLHLIISRGMGGAGRAVMDQVIGRIKDAANPALIMSGSKDEGILWGNVRPTALPPGRGTLVSRAGSVLVQVANLPAQQ
jgi:S-DNA-T family DNA segregation ATPase FtsK/SpoIIIE